MGVFLAYILFSLFVVWMAYKVFKTKKAIFIALIVMILIPTWDVIIGKPIYNYLCKNKAGVHIYKTVDNVEGFYIGEKSKRYEPYEPYKGYKYVDYKEKESGKYYRSYWVDNNTSKDCVPIGDDAWSKDGKLYSWWFHHGKCIVKKEIPEGEVSSLWEIKKEVRHYNIFYLNVDKVKFTILDRKTKEKYFTIIDFFVDNSWITSISNAATGNKTRQNCFEFMPDNHYAGIVETTSGFEIGTRLILNILQSKQGEK